MRRYIFLGVFWLGLLWVICGCDTDKFLGYDYQAERVDHATTINGAVRNIFTEAPVARVRIDIGGQIAFTNNRGQFGMIYQSGEDEALSRPIPVRLSATNYFDFDTVLVIYPRDNRLDVRMVYAAPIIQSASLADSICTAQIMDYQGVEDIDSVISVGFYFLDETDSVFSHRILMGQIDTIDDYAAVYRSIVPDSLNGAGLIRPRYNIIAVDKSGFRDEIAFFSK